MTTDSELLLQYAGKHSESAFAELVQRHINLVYGAALRRVGGDAHLAQDVAQQVFAALARQAQALATRETLAGWLYTTTRNAAAQVVRTERRRQAREQTAFTMQSFSAENPPAEGDWERLRPLLDGALDALNEADREAVLLRFFEGHSFAEIGAMRRTSEDAARVRVVRALDKLHARLKERGVTSTSAALGLALASQASVAAPAGVAASVTGAVLAGAGATAGAGGGWAIFMSMTKLQMGIVAVATGTIGAGYLALGNTNAALETEIAAARRESTQMVALRTENQRLASLAAELEMLRHDDAEFARLEAQVAEVKQANVQKQRVAQASTPNSGGRYTFTGVTTVGGGKISVVSGTVRLPDDERALNEQIVQLNGEGNALVQDYKALAERAKNAPSPEAKLQADADAATKMEEIEAKQVSMQQITAQLNDLQRQRGRAPSAPQAVVLGNGESRTISSATGTMTFSKMPSPGAADAPTGNAVEAPPGSISTGNGTWTFRSMPLPAGTSPATGESTERQ